MKKSSEMDVVKKFAVTTMIPVFVFACVTAKMVLSQATHPDSSIARALGQTELNNSTDDRDSKQILTTDPRKIKDDQNRQKQQPVASEFTQTGKAPQSDLNLLLISAVPGSSSNAKALIKDLESNSVGIYTIGQQIGIGRIVSIEKNKVVLFDEGQSLVLKPAFNAALPETAAPAEVQKKRITPIGSGPVLADYEDYQTPVNYLESVLSNAGLKSFSQNGQVLGLKISGLDDTLLAKEMDLRNGDIIHRVNGHLLISKQQALQVLKKAKSQDTIDVEVLYGD
jgi:type II secretory pathway component PulC